MNVLERKKTVLSMEHMVRTVNDETILESWLMGGVADGDIPSDSFDPECVDDCYIEDETFTHLLNLFLRIMHAAMVDGGLYVDGATSFETKE